jgi:hypothetical protein
LLPRRRQWFTKNKMESERSLFGTLLMTDKLYFFEFITLLAVF